MLAPLNIADEEVVFIEIEDSEIDETIKIKKKLNDVPEGAEYVSNNSNKNNIMENLKKGIETFSEGIYSSLKKANPDEASIEFSLAIKGKINPIPVIVSSSTESTIKVTLKWKKNTNG